MKIWRNILACVLLLWAVCPVTLASAAFYIDPCESLEGDSVKSYSGFSAKISDFASYTGWVSCPDRSALVMQAQQASAVYRVRGSETVEISIYAKNGSFAMPTAMGMGFGAYILGRSETGNLKDAIRCLYDMGHKQVFLMDGGQDYQIRSTPIGLYFSQTDTRMNRQSPYYGVNISYSRDGTVFSEIREISLADFQVQDTGIDNYYFERYRARVPAGTAYIRVQLQSFDTIPGVMMPDMPVPEQLFLLSEVKFEGAQIETGPVKPPDPEPSSSEEEPSSSGEASSEPDIPSSSEESSSSSAPPMPPDSSSSEEESSSIPSQPGPSESEPSSSEPSSSHLPVPEPPASNPEEPPIAGPDPNSRPRPHRSPPRRPDSQREEDMEPLILIGGTTGTGGTGGYQPPGQIPVTQTAEETQIVDDVSVIPAQAPASSSPPIIVHKDLGMPDGSSRQSEFPELPAMSAGVAGIGLFGAALLWKPWEHFHK